MKTVSENMIQAMLEAARTAAGNAYAPYSNFHVGASVLTPTGEIFAGCNVENASYGLTICAERNAIFQAVARGHHRLDAVVVYTPTSITYPPCGPCRQVIYEFGSECQVISTSEGSDPLRATIGQLLPQPFRI